APQSDSGGSEPLLGRELCQWARMLRLVETDFATTRDLESRHEAIALIDDWRHELDPLPSELLNGALHVVAPDEELMTPERLSPARPRMQGHLTRREREDKPPVARIHVFEPEHVTEECARRLRVLGKDDCVRPGDHWGRHSTRAQQAPELLRGAK